MGEELRARADVTGITRIEVGGFHTLALRNDGVWIAWGQNWYGELMVPAVLQGVPTLAAGAYYNVAFLPAPADFRLVARRFGELGGLVLQGEAGETYRVEYASELNQIVWKPAGTVTLQNAEQTWADPDSAGKSARFYRAVLP